MVSADTSKEIVRRLVVEPWDGDFGVIDELVAPNYVGHDPAQPDTQGPQGIKEFITGYLTGFPDGRITIDEQLAEGDLVATRWTGRGTHQGDLRGFRRPASRSPSVESRSPVSRTARSSRSGRTGTRLGCFSSSASSRRWPARRLSRFRASKGRLCAALHALLLQLRSSSDRLGLSRFSGGRTPPTIGKSRSN